MVDVSSQIIHLQAALAHINAQLPAVEQKDAQIVLAAASTTLAGFALVFLGIVMTRPAGNKEMRSEFRMIVGLLLIFWLDLLSAGCSFAWFYLNAPGKIRVPLIGDIGPGFLYQAGWIILWITALLSFYVVIVTVRTVTGFGKKRQRHHKVGPGSNGKVEDSEQSR